MKITEEIIKTKSEKFEEINKQFNNSTNKV